MILHNDQGQSLAPAPRLEGQLLSQVRVESKRGKLPAIIAIDGPVAAGKTTVGRLLARRIGYPFLDTGSMYRALTWLALKEKVALDDEKALADLASRAHIEVQGYGGDGERIRVNGCDITSMLRSPEVEQAVSLVAQVAGVRQVLVRKQREMARDRSIIMAGRDIGTVVLPHADLKLFLLASPEERARRRYRELKDLGQEVDYKAILQDLQRRDQMDSQRSHSPLRAAPEAYLIDTNDLTLEQVVEKILDLWRQGKPAP